MFQLFGQAKFAYGDLIFKLEPIFVTVPVASIKITFNIKVVKIGSKKSFCYPDLICETDCGIPTYTSERHFLDLRYLSFFNLVFFQAEHQEQWFSTVLS